MILTVCEKFNLPDIQSVKPLVSGLINSSYKISLNNGNSYFLQRINTGIFKNPAALQKNYQLIQQHLTFNGAMKLPELVKTATGNLLYDNHGEVWRCFEFVKNTYSPTAVHTPEKAYEVAHCFGSFTAVLQSFDSTKLEVIIPHFHDLDFRYQQFKTALQNAPTERIVQAKDLIQRIEDYASLVKKFMIINGDKKAFPLHIMHHDCKISNILFDVDTNAIRCPIDLDTTQAGFFFSDMGDMVRTIVSSLDENDTRFSELAIRTDFLKAVTEGYMDAMAPFLTAEERSNIPYAGSIMTYMQAMRFLTDHLNGNIYYKTTYPEQNKDRTINQLRLLDLLQEHITGKKYTVA
ncbi:phosphotransferase enzyme family protein [Ilyomonas limi]|nr:aminoglycoside phosphotransferase family protein [Ilyomonas limi]